MTKLFLIFLFILISCGRHEPVPEGYTKVVFGRENSNNKAINNVGLNGGLFIQVINMDLMKSTSGYWDNISAFTANATKILPNGRYKFFALGYDGAGTPRFTGGMYCEPFNNGADVILAGGVVNLNLILNNHTNAPKCRHPHFNIPEMADQSSATQILPFQIIRANGLFGGSVPSNIAFDIDITLMGKDDLFGLPDKPTLSRCMDSNAFFNSQSVKLPVSPHFMFRFTFWSSSDGSCTGTQNRVITFYNGLSSIPMNLIANTGAGTMNELIETAVQTSPNRRLLYIRGQ